MSMFPSSVYELATYVSVWFWQDILACLLGIILIGGQFMRNRKTLYVLVFPITFIIVARMFASYHIVTMTYEEAALGPGSSVKIAWVVYYIFSFGAIAVLAFRIKQLWQGNHWFNRSVGLLLVLLLTIAGFSLVYQPYSLLYDIDREQLTSGKPE